MDHGARKGLAKDPDNLLKMFISFLVTRWQKDCFCKLLLCQWTGGERYLDLRGKREKGVAVMTKTASERVDQARHDNYEGENPRRSQKTIYKIKEQKVI